jgi:hypothetical protein
VKEYALDNYQVCEGILKKGHRACVKEKGIVVGNQCSGFPMMMW